MSASPAASRAVRALALALIVLAGLVAAREAGAARTTRALTPHQRQLLRSLIQDEKCAHDVYRTLGRRWTRLVILRRIAHIESEHVILIARVLHANPVAGYGIGDYPAERFDRLYRASVATGRRSPAAALRVGARIEEEDIVDVHRALDHAAGSPAMRSAMTILLRGSRNHLRRYVRALAARGVTYAPTVLDIDLYEHIVTTPIETGPGWHMRAVRD